MHAKVHKFAHPKVILGPDDYLPGECIHTDHRGPYSQSLGGSRYSQLFLDRKSKYKWVFRDKTKDDVCGAMKYVIAEACARSGRKLRFVKTDGDGGFRSNEFEKLCKKEKIIHERSAPYDHNTNPFIEREQRTVLEGTATALYHAGARQLFFGVNVNLI